MHLHKQFLDRFKPSKALRSWSGSSDCCAAARCGPPVAYWEKIGDRSLKQNYYLCEYVAAEFPRANCCPPSLPAKRLRRHRRERGLPPARRFPAAPARPWHLFPRSFRRQHPDPPGRRRHAAVLLIDTGRIHAFDRPLPLDAHFRPGPHLQQAALGRPPRCRRAVLHYFPLARHAPLATRGRPAADSPDDLLVASLGAAQFGLARFPEASFYLLPTRAWELLIGAIYAVLVAQRHPLAELSSRWHNPLSAIGLLMILASVFLYSPETPFPGWAALTPTLGALLVIAAATPATLVGRLLAWRPMLLVGLWSYSIYLWHQPVFAFARYHLESPGMPLMATLTGLTLGLGYLSWRYVEGPFRKPVWQGGRLAAFAIAGMTIFLVIGLIGKHRSDVLKRFAPEYETQISVERKLSKNYGLDRECNAANAGRQCQTAEKPEVLLWGDSYAMHLADGIVASRADVRLIQRTESGCAPLHGIAPVIGGNRRTAESCIRFNQEVLAQLKQMPSVRHVVLASLFYQYLEPGNEILTNDGLVLPTGASPALKALRETLAQLREMQVSVVLVAPPPANGLDIGKCLARSILLKRNLDHCDFSVGEMSHGRLEVFQLLSELASETHVIWLHDLMCQQGRCSTHEEGTFFFLDEGHLTRDGSALLGKKHDFYHLFRGGRPVIDREMP
jgi:hypothetical protein